MSQNPELWFVVAGIVAVALVALWWWRSRSLPSEEMERRRRLAINGKNRVIEGFVTDADEAYVQFRYDLCGIEYFASQEIGALRKYMPSSPELCIGPVGVKFDPANPANSIVVCEEWSGWQTYTQRGNTWKSISV